jgi:hypothetical protein
MTIDTGRQNPGQQTCSKMLHEAPNGLKPRHRAGSTNHLVWRWLPSGPSDAARPMELGTKDAASIGSAKGGVAIWLL